MTTSPQTVNTKTPAKGNLLTFKMARVVIKATHANAKVHDKLQPVDAENACTLIDLSHVVAAHYATVSSADTHWKETQ